MPYINKACADVAAFAASNGMRPILGTVYVTETHCVATDSFRLLEVENPAVDPNEMPVLTTGGSMVPTPGSGLIPLSAIAKASANSSKSKVLPILENIAVQFDGATATLTTTDLENTDVVSTRVVEGNFPDYQQIMPKEAPTFRFAVNAKYLKEMAAYFQKHTNDKSSKVILEFSDPTKPLIMRAIVGNNQKAVGIIMPLRIDQA